MDGVIVRFGVEGDIDAVKSIADSCRHELGFIPRSVLVQAVRERRLLVAELVDGFAGSTAKVVGFAHYRVRMDGVAVIYEIAVDKQYRGKGIGRKLVGGVVEEARREGCKVLRLKCVEGVEANGFYRRLGFRVVGREAGKRRALLVYERKLERDEGFRFFVGLTVDATEVRKLVRLFCQGYGYEPPFNPFHSVIVTPIATTRATLALVRRWRFGDLSALKCDREPLPLTTVMFDSGGYFVQRGLIDFWSLVSELVDTYAKESWADYFVLPDYPVTHSDYEREASEKLKATLNAGERLMSKLDSVGVGRFVGVVHGKTVEQVVYGARKWHELGVSYIAFGSFSVSGKEYGVNMLTQSSLSLLKALSDEVKANGQRLHIFGIGSPSGLLEIARAGIAIDSFDSTAFWKQGGYGRVFDGDGKGVSAMRLCGNEHSGTKLHMEIESCPFCVKIDELVKSRWRRILHNLVATYEATQVCSRESVMERQLSLPLML